MTPPSLVLASASPRRRDVLTQLGLEFQVRPAPDDVEDPWDGREEPKAFAARLARAKGAAVAAERPDALIVAADTIVVLDGEVLGKPADPAEARSMLARLAGRWHTVHTAVAVAAPGPREAAGVESTEVRFRTVDAPAIAAYVATGEPLDKAGAYGIQGSGAALVEEIRGCYFNVMGLPVQRVFAALEEVGWRYSFPGGLESTEERISPPIP